MKNKTTLLNFIFGTLSFLIPFIIYRLTSVNALMFDDAGEFALVIKLGSIAHPPGTPAYIFLAGLWTKLTDLLNVSTITSLNTFASICVSTACLLIYFSFAKIGDHLKPGNSLSVRFISMITAIGFGTAATTWAWANNIEVYSFQILTMSILLFGLISFQFKKNIALIVIAGIGIGLGLAGHHLTMIFFLPVAVLFLIDGIFSNSPDDPKKKKQKEISFIEKLTAVFKSKAFIVLTSTSAIVMFIFYGWMYMRAQTDYPFMFGQPKTLDLLLYHIKGGSYGKNLTSASTDIISSRFPFFLKLTAMQFFVLLPFLFIGIREMLKGKMKIAVYSAIFYFLAMFIYQLNNNQWSSTDAYLLLPFLVLTIPVFIGCLMWEEKWKLKFVLPVLILIQIGFNYKDHNKKSYPVSTDLMELLDKSAPKNSVVLISDWSTIIQYYYFRIVENFRTDLVVINYDMKFTHYRILPVLYPEFYQKIKPEYDKYISELGKEHPEQITNTGCDLSTEILNQTFRNLVLKTEEVCKKENRFYLTDPKAHYFFSTNKFYQPGRYVSGCFSSSQPGDSISAEAFLKMDFAFLSSPLLMNDPSSLDKMVDFQAMLDNHISFYKANNNLNKVAEAEFAKEKVMKLQRELKKSMSFAYKIK